MKMYKMLAVLAVGLCIFQQTAPYAIKNNTNIASLLRDYIDHCVDHHEFAAEPAAPPPAEPAVTDLYEYSKERFASPIIRGHIVRNTAKHVLQATRYMPLSPGK